jgi:hypothetical protein
MRLNKIRRPISRILEIQTTQIGHPRRRAEYAGCNINVRRHEFAPVYQRSPTRPRLLSQHHLLVDRGGSRDLHNATNSSRLRFAVSDSRV